MVCQTTTQTNRLRYLRRRLCYNPDREVVSLAENAKDRYSKELNIKDNYLQQESYHFMPIYEYACQKCGHHLELMQKIGDPAPKRCPNCRKGKMEKMISRTSFQLKGSGWYASDYAKPAVEQTEAKTAAKADNKTETKADTKTDSKADSKSSTKNTPASTTT